MIISFIYFGRAIGHACGVRVDGASPRGLWPPVGGGLCSLALRGQGERFLGLTGLMAGGFLGLTALQAEGCGGGLAADYKVSVTEFIFNAIWYNKHSADWLAALASPYPASPDFHLKVKRLTMICASLALLQIMFAVHPRESVSHDSQVASLPYESCSLATPIQGAE